MGGALDSLAEAASRYHQLRERLRRIEQRTGFAAAMGRDSLREDLEAAERELHDAADVYGAVDAAPNKNESASFDPMNQCLDCEGPLEPCTCREGCPGAQCASRGDVRDPIRVYGACSCLHTVPCHDRCACVMPFSSSGCRRCCTYGSAEQQAARAEKLARFIDRGEREEAAR